MLFAVTVLNWLGADHLWPGALNLYLPQIMWALPGLFLALFFFKVDRRRIWLPLLCVLWVLGPIMGFCWSLPAAKPASGSLAVRVMTWNIKYGSYRIAPLIEEIARRDPDVVFLQDATGSMKGPLGDYFKNWQVRSYGQYVIASRFPLSQAEVGELPTSSDKQECFLRCQMRIGTAVVALYNLHLKTPRRSLNAFRTARRQPWYLPEAIDYFNANVRLRQLQAMSMLEFLSEEHGPVIVAGDLNAPDASTVCATLRDAGLHDAFAESGAGYGFTYGHFLFKNRLPWLRASWMRIDHIMVNSWFVARRCWAGSGKASDHRPVIADLVLKYP
ncbi:MAG: endonuclease [Geobacteraceae bacterium GWC2_58_44]|nr:MAG: endonuclease [Geobacteraceae bacterium GWC2_58_44]HBG08078.1 endonuclease [Geobacter sp.]